MDVKKIQKEWVDALRSGEYKQGYRMLKQGEYYCCLGVLGCVLQKNGVENIELDNRWYLEEKIVNPYLEGLYSQHYFAEFNDLDHLRFAQIADLIEKRLIRSLDETSCNPT